MATKFMNEAAHEFNTYIDSTQFTYSSESNGNTLILRIAKNKEGGISTDFYPIDFVRLYCEGTGQVSVKKVNIIKFGGLKFEKLNQLSTTIPSFPISGNPSPNGYIDVPIGIADEVFEIELTTGGSGYIYAYINGAASNITKENLPKLK